MRAALRHRQVLGPGSDWFSSEAARDNNVHISCRQMLAAVLTGDSVHTWTTTPGTAQQPHQVSEMFLRESVKLLILLS